MHLLINFLTFLVCVGFVWSQLETSKFNSCLMFASNAGLFASYVTF